MPRHADFEIECPNSPCEAVIDIWWDPGEPAVMYYRDGSGYPGAPAGIDSWDSDCDCYENGVVDKRAYDDALDEAAREASQRGVQSYGEHRARMVGVE